MDLRLLFLLFFFWLSSASEISYDGRALKIDGERRILFSGSIHYPRSTPEMWPDLIQKAKEGGLDAIETYVFWDAHEPRRREYHFDGNLDLVGFLKTVQAAQLYAVLRIGPYVCAEWNYGGFPVWLHQIPGIQLRTNNEIYKNFTTFIVNKIQKENLLASQGGPIILTQIENEYGNVMGPYGDAGKAYVQWCASLAESYNLSVPWIMCQQSDAPKPIINTCNGFYCDSFYPNSGDVPKMWTENWTGWFKSWGSANPHRPVEDIAYSVARFFLSYGTFVNYYMYHGGTNFGRTAGGPYITTSYDYDAPLDEYGNIRQPKWGHLKELHSSLKKMEKVLTYGDRNNTNLIGNAWVTTYTYNGSSGCFLSNTNRTADIQVIFRGVQYMLPAWSVSILPDCQEEVYNTAKVNTQTSVMTKKPHLDQIPLKWVWLPEPINETLSGKGSFTLSQLVEQISVTGDTSDYLWYLTSVNISQEDPFFSNEMTLRVNTTGHALYAFVNGRIIGSHIAPHGDYSFVFEQVTPIKPGVNIISLLSATTGLANYGAYFDLLPTGIVGGPVELIGNKNITKDLSQNPWSYKIGMNGEEQEYYSGTGSLHWHNDSDLPENKVLTWYQTTFETPPGADGIVVDLQGMTKGSAWVNGKSIGRYWPSSLADTSGCAACDYRGPYSNTKCETGCGQPTQRWYHIPRSFVHDVGDNTLTLFEEVGGNPRQINFQTIVVNTICGNVREGRKMELSCGNQRITDIKFASFGNPEGTCGSFLKGTCDNNTTTMSIVKQACLGRNTCTIDASNHTFALGGCNNTAKRLAVEATCWNQMGSLLQT